VTETSPPGTSERATSERRTSLSILVPVYNEQYLVAESLRRLEVLASSPCLDRVEVIVVDDCSKDGTPEVLRRFEAERVAAPTPPGAVPFVWRFLRHEKNGGKGTAVRTALAEATCEIAVIHDADLEYHPRDLLRVVAVFVDEGADAVFGSRFAGGEVRRVLLYRHELGNRLLTFLCNMVTNLNVTDMETCYKAVRTDLLKSIPLRSNDFRLEPELTIKLAKRGVRLFEVPISYSGRTYQEGKKINWRDGFRALAAIVRFALSDDVYQKDAYGSAILARLGRAPKFNAWMADIVRPWCGNRVLEIGGGVGALTLELVPRWTFFATDVNPVYLRRLEALRRDRPYLHVQHVDVARRETFPELPDGFDTVVCLNVIEHIEDDVQAMANLRRALAPGGRAIVLVPQGPWNYGSIDRALGHCRRYTEDSLTTLAQAAGFSVERLERFNRLGSLPWFVSGRVFRRETVGLFQVRMLNLLTPLMRLVDAVLPLPALSLIAVLTPAPLAASRDRDERQAEVEAGPALERAQP
jgi:glycosyltransferase involved in cell wall biosynthesis